MALYLLKRIGDTNWDETAGFVVSAFNASSARELAWEADYGDGYRMDRLPWRDPERSTCEYIASSSYQPYGVVLQDFRAG